MPVGRAGISLLHGGTEVLSREQRCNSMTQGGDREWWSHLLRGKPNIKVKIPEREMLRQGSRAAGEELSVKWQPVSLTPTTPSPTNLCVMRHQYPLLGPLMQSTRTGRKALEYANYGAPTLHPVCVVLLQPCHLGSHPFSFWPVGTQRSQEMTSAGHRSRTRGAS